MSARKTWILCGLMLLAARAAAQGEDPPDEPAPSPAEEQPEPPTQDSDDVFIPTEEIPADEEVTFPVNI
jgi:hypothetical protein